MAHALLLHNVVEQVLIVVVGVAGLVIAIVVEVDHVVRDGFDVRVGGGFLAGQHYFFAVRLAVVLAVLFWLGVNFFLGALLAFERQVFCQIIASVLYDVIFIVITLIDSLDESVKRLWTFVMFLVIIIIHLHTFIISVDIC
jgi:hypothetical protein